MVSYGEALKLSIEPMAFFQCAQQSKIARLAGLTHPQRCKEQGAGAYAQVTRLGQVTTFDPTSLRC